MKLAALAAAKMVARQGRALLVAGLVIGIVFPGLSRAMMPAVAPLIVVLLFLAALRIGPAGMTPRGQGRALRRGFGLMLAMQLALPLAALALLAPLGALGGVLAAGVVLVLAAPPLTGSPGLAALSGADPGVALRQLVISTAFLPLTALPVLFLLPLPGAPETRAAGEMLAASLGMAGRLVVMIALAAGGAWLVRRRVPALNAPDAPAVIDAGLALTMGLVVIGLMSAVGPALMAGDPALFAGIALSFLICFGLQIATFRLMAQSEDDPASLAILAGNRNLAIFLAAVPPDSAAALMLFVGCYQVPMYLTPLFAPWLYRRGRGIG